MDDGYWDKVLKEQSYYKHQDDPTKVPECRKGREIGEFDVLAVNESDKIAMYTEIKSKHSHLEYAEEQIERAQEFFEDTEWTIIGRSLVYSN